LLHTATGIINSSGLGSSGIEMLGGTGNLLRTEGMLNISGAGAHGIYVLSGTADTLDNRGTLNITGPRGNSLRTDDGGNTLLNNGNILVGGSDAFGVFMQGTANTLTNSGTIRAKGVNADGVVSNTVAGNFAVTIDNSGSIVSDRRFAVRGVNGQETVINSGLIGSGTAPQSTFVLAMTRGSCAPAHRSTPWQMAEPGPTASSYKGHVPPRTSSGTSRRSG